MSKEKRKQKPLIVPPENPKLKQKGSSRGILIPGKSDYPSDEPKYKRCPHCGHAISIPVPIYDSDGKKIKLVCPACGEKIQRFIGHDE